jgi:hypothetical protein
MACYLQPEWIICPIKAAVGEDVLTQFGDGRVLGYNAARNMYTISLKWGAQLYTTADQFDRADGFQDGRSRFGVKWLMDFLFSSNAEAVSRSRSNSVASGSISNRSAA